MEELCNNISLKQLYYPFVKYNYESNHNIFHPFTTLSSLDSNFEFFFIFLQGLLELNIGDIFIIQMVIRLEMKEQEQLEIF